MCATGRCGRPRRGGAGRIGCSGEQEGFVMDKNSSINSVGDEALAKAVFERVKGDLAQLRTDELLHISLDIPQAVSTVLGVLPDVKRLREQIVKDLPSFDVARFDKLEDYAH